MRFMTLTSPKNPKRNIKKSLDILKKRIARANVKKDGFVGFKFNRYFCLRTLEGNGVLHIVYWGRYIPQEWLSRMWNDIHGAFRVDIRACFTKRRRVDGLVGYLLTNYLNQQPIERMSYGWKWAWRGFCKGWTKVKQTYGMLRRGTGEFRTTWNIYPRANKDANYNQNNTISFKTKYHNQSVEAWYCTLWDCPATSRQTKLFGGKSLKWQLPELKNVVKKSKVQKGKAVEIKTIGDYANRLLNMKSKLFIKQEVW